MRTIFLLVSLAISANCGIIHHDEGHGKATSYQSIKFEHFHAVPTYVKKEDAHLLKNPIPAGHSAAKVEVHHGGKHDHGYALADSHSTYHGHGGHGFGGHDGGLDLSHASLGHESLGHESLGHEGLDHASLGHGGFEHASLGHASLGHAALESSGHEGLAHDFGGAEGGHFDHHGGYSHIQQSVTQEDEGHGASSAHYHQQSESHDQGSEHGYQASSGVGLGHYH